MVAPKATKLTSFPRDQFLTNIAHGATVNCNILSSQIFAALPDKKLLEGNSLILVTWEIGEV